MQTSVNHLPVLTWEHCRINHTLLQLPGEPDAISYADKTDLPVGVSRQADVKSEALYAMFEKLGIENPKEEIVAGKVPMYNRQSFATGMGEGVDRLMDQAPACVYTVESSFESDRPVKLRYSYAKGRRQLLRIFIHAKAGSESTFLLQFSALPKECEYLDECGKCETQQELLQQKRKQALSGKESGTGEKSETESGAEGDADRAGYLGVQTYLYLEEGARVHFHTVQMLDPEMLFFHDIGGYLHREAGLFATKLDLGALRVYEGLNVLQAGDESRFEMDYGTLGLPGGETDINYNDVFTGKRAEGRMYFKEALLGNAKKTFRGTLDFRQYSTASKGDEQEDIILLGDEVENRTIPLILCEEEDVDGRHAATVGTFSDEMLFYMQTRGISAEKARELMVRSSLLHIANKVPSESVKKAVQNAVCMVFE